MADDQLDETLKRYFDSKLKFNYFILSTTLAILGISIQVIKPSNSDIYPSLVFVSWGTLLLSFISGLIWQCSWIQIQGDLHSSLLKLRTSKNNKITDNSKSTMRRMVLSEMFQILFMVLGVFLIGTYKIVNFYWKL